MQDNYSICPKCSQKLIWKNKYQMFCTSCNYTMLDHGTKVFHKEYGAGKVVIEPQSQHNVPTDALNQRFGGKTAKKIVENMPSSPKIKVDFKKVKDGDFLGPLVVSVDLEDLKII